jgi:hypothetical protein
VERFFNDFEKEINKSILEFNVSMKDNYRDVENQIGSLRTEIAAKIENLGTEKVLKTIIAYFSKEEEKRINESFETMRETLEICGGKRAALAVETNSIQKMVNELSQFMCLSFENWEQDVKYGADFVKTGFSSAKTDRSKYSNGKSD